MIRETSTEKPRTREDVVEEWLRRYGPLASCQFNERERTGYSERALATGINNLVHLGRVECAGSIKRYKVWRLVSAPVQLEIPMAASCGAEARP